ncbi:MAG: CBS domain-containing protein [Ardenticatenaceae bacterium]|nr:CBS domain-containing protein [Ardenticatenaceae bacterium]MCB9444771.1 CBS domain-containing protein [Ardenticatenaceae bacterium]
MMRLELVRDWMTRDVIFVEPDTLLSVADDLLAAHRIRRLPVVENGRLVGIVTYGDIREARPSPSSRVNLWEMQYLMSQLVVAEIMTADPLTVLQDATVGEAAQLMLKQRIGGLPVVDTEGVLVGIITESDIFRLVVRDWLRSEEDSAEPFARYS